MNNNRVNPVIRTNIFRPSIAEVRQYHGNSPSATIEFDGMTITFNDAQELALWVESIAAKAESLIPESD